jgi:hypothetical protein
MSSAPHKETIPIALPTISELVGSVIGAILFFRAMEMSEFAKERIAALCGSAASIKNNKLIDQLSGSSHPPLAERIARIEALTIKQTTDDQRDHVTEFVKEYALIASALSSIVIDIFRGLGPST